MSTKAKLLNGTSFNKEIEVEFNGEVFPFTVRPISNEEWAEIEAKINNGRKQYFDPKMAKTQYIELSDATKRSYQSKVDTFIKGVVCEEYTDKEVKSLPVGIVEKVVAKIISISGVAQEGEDTKN